MRTWNTTTTKLGQHRAFKSQSNHANSLVPNFGTDGAESTSFVPHILIVDDDDRISYALEQLLVESGYAVSKSRQASEALEELEKEHIDLVVTDVRLPGMSGVELTKRITERWPDVPIIVITGFSEIEIAVEVLKLGA